jgi:hypothetical protein
MAQTFTDQFRLGADLPFSEELRSGLGRAIQDQDEEGFRQRLRQAFPELAGQHRLYGVLVKTPEGLRPLLVDETGRRIRDDSVIERGTPIHLLNVEYGPTEMRARIGNEIWTAPVQSPRPQGLAETQDTGS